MPAPVAGHYSYSGGGRDFYEDTDSVRFLNFFSHFLHTVFTIFMFNTTRKNIDEELKMKKIFFVLLGLFFLSGVVYATGFDMVKKAGDVTVKLSIEKAAPVVGKNNISVELFNARKGSITDAEVELAYFMPAMPAMKYETGAIQKGSAYTAVLGLAMAGQWNVDVIFRRPARKFKKITFSINAK